ncbi:MAG: YggT family protein [Candidatus Krumholzibacteriia bacterium]
MDVRGLLLALLQVYSWLILARVIISWVNPRPTNPLLWQIVRVTEPVLAPLRGLIPFGPVDFSPILAFLLIRLVMTLIA